MAKLIRKSRKITYTNNNSLIVKTRNDLQPLINRHVYPYAKGSQEVNIVI